MDTTYYWERYKKYLYQNDELGLQLDISRMNFPEHFFKIMEPGIQRAYQEMERLEQGFLANPDEERMVGHYWLRAPRLAPSQEITNEIIRTQEKIIDFAKGIQRGEIRSTQGKSFQKFLLVGIGGSALGPQLVAYALDNEKLKPYFIDNTDPDGIDKTLHEIGDDLGQTLVLVVSKSGGTVETRNGMVEVKEAFQKRNIDFRKNFIAVTATGSQLDRQAQGEGWLKRYPIWDWIGGRTSITSPVGILPLALQGIDVLQFLEGAKDCDEITRITDTANNPAALLALMWFYATGGQGRRDMVILPYRDGLQYLSKYLQQLIMESLGKEKDLSGNTVNQGIAVYGNKGTTDQHAYVQQLLDGVENFFVTFLEVLTDRRQEAVFVEKSITSGDYLRAFLLGTREALTTKGRESLTISLKSLNPHSLGILIALYERAVGFYGSLVNINAYHQPGVELGKKGANRVIELQKNILSYLGQRPGQRHTPRELAEALKVSSDIESIYKTLEYLSLAGKRGIKKEKGSNEFSARYYHF